MKNNVFRVICFAVSFFYGLSLLFFGLPLWTVILFLPALIYIQLFITFQASYRESLAFQEIPLTGYEKRLNDLSAKEIAFYELGFRKFDEFYLSTVPDIVSYSYYHEQYPILLQHAHLDVSQVIALQTKFVNDNSLETSDSKNAGILILENRKMLQAFPGRNTEELLHRHIEGLNFLAQNGYTPKPLNLQCFRQEFLQELKIELRKAKAPVAPITLLYRMLFGKNKNYQKPIQEQHLAKTLALP